VETSGKDSLTVFGTVEASAFNGNSGTWLIDPTNITINNGTGSIGSSTLGANTINNALNSGTSVELTTVGGTGGSGDIALNSSINKTATNSANLTLNASRYLTPSASSVINMPSGNLRIGLNQEGLAVSTNPTIKNAINSVGTVVGSTNINLGTGTYTEGEISINKSLKITGNGASNTTISGNNLSRVFNISGANVTLDGLTITQGKANQGGGILVNSGSTLHINNSTLSNNQAFPDGGAIYNNGTTNIKNSLFVNNTANDVGSGGAIWNNGTLDIINSTFSQNKAGGNGGAINNNSGTTSLSNSTLTQNETQGKKSSGGSIFTNSGKQVSVKNTIIAKNTAQKNQANDVYGSFTDQGNNLIGIRDGSTGFTLELLGNKLKIFETLTW
jgi:hypothetical protein